jgi:hypothetical protein
MIPSRRLELEKRFTEDGIPFVIELAFGLHQTGLTPSCQKRPNAPQQKASLLISRQCEQILGSSKDFRRAARIFPMPFPRPTK